VLTPYFLLQKPTWMSSKQSRCVDAVVHARRQFSGYMERALVVQCPGFAQEISRKRLFVNDSAWENWAAASFPWDLAVVCCAGRLQE